MSKAVVDNASLIRFPSQREMLTALLRGWWLILLGAILGLVWGANSLYSAPYLYRVEMTVVPAQQGGGGGAQGALAQLANLGIVSGGAQSDTDFKLYLDLLTSRKIADELAKDPSIMRTIYAGNWDDMTQSWRDVPDTRRWVILRNELYDYLGFPPQKWHAPDGESMLGFLAGTIIIEQDPRRPYMAKVTMQYADKDFAIRFLKRLHQVADNTLRQTALQRATDYIAYLTSELSKVTIAEHRLALAQSLSEQEKAAMMARSSSAFAADLFEPPWAGSYPSSPQAMTTLARTTFIGALIGSFLALLLWMTRGKISRLVGRFWTNSAAGSGVSLR